jgi:peptidoglycan/xylan/chitin deacetylase (PgdA/CDA1 family)
MRTIIAFAIVLLGLPALVFSIQLHRAGTGIGTRAGYLEIEQPRTLQAGDPVLRDPGVAVLCYHYISPPPTLGHVARVAAAVILNLPTLDEKYFWSLPVDMFEAHLRWLRDNGYETLTAAEVSDIMHRRRPVPEKAVAITFDDGERSVLDHALPLLEKYDMKATLFVVTGQVGRKWKGLDMLSWAELAQLQSSGRVAIESHSHDMHYKVKSADSQMEPVHVYRAPETGEYQPEERVAADLRASRDALRRHLRIESRTLAWPYGFANRRLDRIAREAGFEATFSLSPGAARPDEDSPWHIQRFTITARTTVKLLSEMVDDGVGQPDVLYGARIDR